MSEEHDDELEQEAWLVAHDTEDEPEGLSSIFKYISRHKSDVAFVIFVICFATFVYLALTYPAELYRAYGEIVRIDESGFGIDIKRVSAGVNQSTVPLSVNAEYGICFLTPEFGYQQCRLGTHVELVRYANRFREFWYINALLEDYEDYGIQREEPENNV